MKVESVKCDVCGKLFEPPRGKTFSFLYPAGYAHRTCAEDDSGPYMSEGHCCSVGCALLLLKRVIHHFHIAGESPEALERHREICEALGFAYNATASTLEELLATRQASCGETAKE